MVPCFVCEEEEETRQAAVASDAKQGQWMNWHGVERRKISWRELWATDANHIKCIVGASYDEDRNCLGIGSLKRILSLCQTSLTQGCVFV